MDRARWPLKGSRPPRVAPRACKRPQFIRVGVPGLLLGSVAIRWILFRTTFTRLIVACEYPAHSVRIDSYSEMSYMTLDCKST